MSCGRCGKHEKGMARALVIVESPTKARTIAGYLGTDVTVKSSVGHIRDLPLNKAQVPADKLETHGRLAGIDPDNHFDTVYIVPSGKKKVVTELKQALKGVDELYLATDEDREGEAIAWHLLEVLSPKVPVKRMVFHEITPHAIRDAIDNPRDVDMTLVEAQEGRRVLDRLMGWELSPVCWRKIGKNAPSAGRVQSVALRLVVERERARMAFRSGSWFDLDGVFGAQAIEFGAKLSELDGTRLAVGGDFDAATGAGYRMIAELDPQVPVLWAIDAQSQSGHPGSPYYNDQLPAWLDGHYHLIPLDRPAEARSSLRLEAGELS